jgi:hypothetical protein
MDYDTFFFVHFTCANIWPGLLSTAWLPIGPWPRMISIAAAS